MSTPSLHLTKVHGVLAPSKVQLKSITNSRRTSSFRRGSNQASRFYVSLPSDQCARDEGARRTDRVARPDRIDPVSPPLNAPVRNPHPLAMPPKGVSTRIKPVRLQSIDRLKIKRPNKHEQTPCQTAMSAVLSKLGPPRKMISGWQYRILFKKDKTGL